jgi:predicted ATPase/class 3 adenylate cyclase
MTVEPGPGTLTFLFADLESSTRLWEQFPDAMKAAMERHDAILRASVEDARGSVIKTTGDGLMAGFPSACDAVLAALTAQQGLAAEQWAETGPLRARIGLHSGEAQAREGDYFGPPVYRAARIMSAAHGGQVLLSGLTATLAREGGLPAGATLRDLGEHRLKDLLQPEHILQLAHPDLPAEFPPLTTLARHPHNLPIQASELIGREDEQRAIRDHIESGTVRLLTLTGPGGIGKTRLALQAAADQVDRFADGVFFIDLSGARDTETALAAIVRTVGLKAAGDARLEDVLKEQLRGQRLLLVLDNFEQVMAAADAVADLLQHCAGLKVLVTSREALRVRGEQLFPVAPLALPEPAAGRLSAASVVGYEAVRLFVDRAQAARPDFALTDANAAAVAEVCTRLDGLPLAIELAAARLKLFSPEDLRDRLRRRLEVLRGGARDLPARQQTLRGTIEWSYELLDDDERAVFQLLAAFADARVEAVEEVVSRTEAVGEIDVVDRLSSLVDKSLVRSIEGPGGHRLSMLETIREYATERLGANAALSDAARRAHAEYFAEFAESKRTALQGPDRDTAITDLSADLGNLQAAWRYWLDAGNLTHLNTLLDALWILHETRGWYHDAIALASDLLDVLATTPASAERLEEELTLRMSLARGLLAVRGYTEEVEEVYRAALELAQSAGELPQRLPVLRSLANFYLYRGEIDKTMAMGHQMLELGEREGDSRLQVEGNFLVGVTTAFSGDVALGQQHMARATALFDPRRHGPTSLRLGPSVGVTTHTTSALIHWFTGFADSADRQADEAIDLASRLNHPYTTAYAHFHVGLLKAFGSRFDEAAVHAETVFEVAEEHDYAIWRALAAVLRGLLTARRGHPADGLAQSEEGLVLYQGLTTPPIFWSSVLSLHADTTALAGDHQRAIQLVDQALAIINELDLRAPQLIVQKGELLAAAGQPSEAEEWLRRGLDSAQRLGARMAQLRAATVLVRLGPGDGAEDDLAALRDTLAQFSEGFDSPDLVDARAALDAHS